MDFSLKICAAIGWLGGTCWLVLGLIAALTGNDMTIPNTGAAAFFAFAVAAQTAR